METVGNVFFYQVDSFQKVSKREQRKEFFQKLDNSKQTSSKGAAGTWQGKEHGYRRRDAKAGRAQKGLTKAEAVALDVNSRGKTIARKREKKRNKQRRHRLNRRLSQREASRQKKMIKIDRRRFHVPKNNQKINRRKIWRRKHREFMSAMASGLRKKEECKELRTRRDEDRKKVLRRKGVRRKIQNKVKKLVKERKQEWRRKWRKWTEENQNTFTFQN